MHSSWTAIYFLMIITVLLCEDRLTSESVDVKGQFDVSDADDNEEISPNDAELINDKLFDELASLRIARDYLQRKIKEERPQQTSTRRNVTPVNSKV